MASQILTTESDPPETIYLLSDEILADITNLAVSVMVLAHSLVMLQSELDISQNLVNLYNFERKCHENEPQEIFS